ncbi:MAG: KH domain-containing protein [Candidatus Krumholzibacteriia bacterium]
MSGAPENGFAPDQAPEHADELTIGQERVLELVSFVVVNLVEHMDDVTVDIVRREGRDVYRVKVHPEDLGKVIGKGGQTARALRVLLAAVSARTDQRLGLEIVE